MCSNDFILQKVYFSRLMWVYVGFILVSCLFWMILNDFRPGFLAVVWFGSSPAPFVPLPSASCRLSFSVFLCVADRAYWRERGATGWARSQIMWPRESLALYKSFTVLSAANYSNHLITTALPGNITAATQYIAISTTVLNFNTAPQQLSLPCYGNALQYNDRQNTVKSFSGCWCP